MRFAHYGPRGRFRSEKATPYGSDLPVIGAGFIVVMTVMFFIAWLFPAMMKRWHELPARIGSRRPDYPQVARETGIEGEVWVQFTLDRNGFVSDPQIVKSTPSGVFDTAVMGMLATTVYRSDPNLPREAIRLVTMIQRFQIRDPDHPGEYRYPMMFERIVYGRFDRPPECVARTELVLPRDAGWNERPHARFVEVEDIREQWFETLITFTVNETGRVVDPVIHRFFNHMLGPAHRRAIRMNALQWQYEPAYRNGEPVSVTVTQRIDLSDYRDILRPGG